MMQYHNTVQILSINTQTQGHGKYKRFIEDQQQAQMHYEASNLPYTRVRPPGMTTLQMEPRLGLYIYDKTSTILYIIMTY